MQAGYRNFQLFRKVLFNSHLENSRILGFPPIPPIYENFVTNL